MTADAILVLKGLFVTIFSLFTSFRIPGTFATPLSWALLSLCFISVLRMLKGIFTIGNLDDSEDVRGFPNPFHWRGPKY